MSQFPVERPRAAQELPEVAAGFVGRVFGLVAFSLAFATIGGFVGTRISDAWVLPIFIAELALIFIIPMVREREPLNMVLLYGFAALSGVVLGKIIERYVDAGLGDVVVQALAVTGVMTAGIAAFALWTQWDLRKFFPYLFVGVIGLLVAMIANIWVGGSMLYGVISWVGAALFTAMLVVRINSLRYHEPTMGNAVVAALGIYIDVTNLFLFILRILGGSGGRRD